MGCGTSRSSDVVAEVSQVPFAMSYDIPFVEQTAVLHSDVCPAFCAIAVAPSYAQSVSTLTVAWHAPLPPHVEQGVRAAAHHVSAETQALHGAAFAFKVITCCSQRTAPSADL